MATMEIDSPGLTSSDFRPRRRDLDREGATMWLSSGLTDRVSARAGLGGDLDRDRSIGVSSVIRLLLRRC
jgi:hypothetical protein